MRNTDSPPPRAAPRSPGAVASDYRDPVRALRRYAHLPRMIARYRNWRHLARGLRDGEPPTRAELRDGLAFEGADDGTLLGLLDEILFTRVYSPPGFEIEEGDTVVEIGANIGVFSVLTGKRTRGPVHVYEPFRANVNLLERNLSLNGVTHVVPHAVAVAGHAGTASLYLSEISGGHLLFDHNASGELTESVEVPTTTLSDLLDQEELATVDLLKLDCEGSEGAILGSATDDSLQRVRRIAMEFHDNVSALDHEALRARLEGAGFAVSTRWDGTSPFGYMYAHQVRAA